MSSGNSKRFITLHVIMVWTILFTVMSISFAETATDENATETNGSKVDADAVSKTQQFREAVESSRDKIRKRIEMIRMWGLVSELNLDEETAKKIFPIINTFQKQQYDLALSLHKVKLQLAEVISQDQSQDEKLQHLITQYREYMIKETQLISEKFDKIFSFLNTKQKAQYILFGDRFNRELKTIIQQIKTENYQKKLHDLSPQSSPDN